MIPEPVRTQWSSRTEAVLRERARELGLVCWSVSTDGSLLECPETGKSGFWINSPDVESMITDYVASLNRSGDPPASSEACAGMWFVPIPIKKRRRVCGYVLCAAFGPEFFDSALFESACASVMVVPQVARAASAADARFDETTAAIAGRTLRWMSADISKLDEAAADSDDLTRELTNAYETMDLLYEVGGSMASLTDPTRFVAGLLDRVLTNQGFRWAWLTIEAGKDSSQIDVMRGSAPGSPEALRGALAERMDPQDVSPNSEIVNDLGWGDGVLTPQAVVRAIRVEDALLGWLVAGDKQSEDPQVSSYDTRLIDTLGSFVGSFFENERLYSEQRSLFEGSLTAITRAIDAKDRYTRGHSERVAYLSVQIAKSIGLNEREQERLWIAGLVHDVGKIGVPESVLTKPGRLTEEEFGRIKQHPEIGNEILSKLTLLDDVRPAVLSHHERWDGRGYPQGLKGEQIPLFARIVCLADTFDAMSSNRSYRSARPRDVVLQEISDCAGTQFDPELAKCFERVDLEGYDELIRKHKDEPQPLDEAA